MNRRPTPSIIDAVLVADVAPDRTALRTRLRWDYSQVAPVDRRTVEDAAVDILANGQRATAGMMAIGSRLLEVKRMLPHGQFSDWCTTEFDMSQRSAQIWMNAARAFEGKSAEISLLSDSSLALLAAPSTPEPARLEAIQEAQATGRSPSVQRTKEIIAQHKPGPAVPPIPAPTAREYAAAVQDRSAISNQQSPISNPPPVTVDVLPPSDAPLPAWAEEPAPAATYDVVDNPDERIPAARALIRLYQSVLDSEETFGDLTGRYSAMLPIQREIKIMITQLVNLIHIIQHPEEVTPDN